MTDILSCCMRMPGKKKAEFGNDLLKKLLEWGKKNKIRYFQTEASEFTKGLFEKFGFKTVEIEQVVRNGLVFMHYKMVLDFSENLISKV